MAGEAPPPGGWRMEDVARRAGVSQMTVSRALRTPEKVASATRARIAAAVAELDYVPDLVAGGLAARRSGLVAVIVSTLENSIFAATVQGLSAALHGRATPSCWVPPTTPARARRNSCAPSSAAGRTGSCSPTTSTPRRPGACWPLPESRWSRPGTARGADRRRGRVLEPRRRPGDGAGAARLRLPADRVRRQRGEDDRRGRLRREGYRAALAELGAGPPREVDLPAAVIGITDGPAASTRCFAAYPDADAAFCVVDALAAGLLLACRRRGVDVPGRLGVAGFGASTSPTPTPSTSPPFV
jgi:LacI family gluconate utilization system Gnt-I transcriptional repressor